jgi:hypothetical protein
MGKVASPAHKFNQVIGGIIIRLKNSERARVDTPCMKTVDTWRMASQDKFDFILENGMSFSAMSQSVLGKCLCGGWSRLVIIRRVASRVKAPSPNPTSLLRRIEVTSNVIILFPAATCAKDMPSKASCGTSHIKVKRRVVGSNAGPLTKRVDMVS